MKNRFYILFFFSTFFYAQVDLQTLFTVDFNKSVYEYDLSMYKEESIKYDNEKGVLSLPFSTLKNDSSHFLTKFKFEKEVAVFKNNYIYMIALQKSLDVQSDKKAFLDYIIKEISDSTSESPKINDPFLVEWENSKYKISVIISDDSQMSVLFYLKNKKPTSRIVDSIKSSISKLETYWYVEDYFGNYKTYDKLIIDHDKDVDKYVVERISYFGDDSYTKYKYVFFLSDIDLNGVVYEIRKLEDNTFNFLAKIKTKDDSIYYTKTIVNKSKSLFPKRESKYIRELKLYSMKDFSLDIIHKMVDNLNVIFQTNNFKEVKNINNY